MERVLIVPCPHCHCPRSSVVQVRERFGMGSELRQCDHCGRQFSHIPTITYVTVRCLCPVCSSPNPSVTRTVQVPDPRATVRYHRCGCGCTFKSYESHEKKL